jgi:hypothetical protein
MKHISRSVTKFDVLLIAALISSFALIIHFTFYDGKLVGVTEGEVILIYQAPAGGGKNPNMINKAKILTRQGIELNVICEVQCKKGLMIKVYIYEPIFDDELLYIRKST